MISPNPPTLARAEGKFGIDPARLPRAAASGSKPLPLGIACGQVQTAGADRRPVRVMQKKQRKLDPAYRRKALELRRNGATFAQIGAALGIGRKAVSKLIDRELARQEQEARENAGAALGLELERLDAALRVASAVMNNPGVSADKRLRAIDRVLRVEFLRCRLLGLLAPTKIAPVTPDGKRPYASPGPPTDADRLRRIQDLLTRAGVN